MKLKAEIEIDYLSDEGTIDEQIQDKIAAQILEKISNSSIKNLYDKAESLINARAEKLVDKVFEDIMSQEITITDSWGNATNSYKNTQEMIKHRFDVFMLENVDDNGQKSSYGRQSRLDLIVRKQLDATAKDFTTKAVKEVTEKIKTVLSDDLKLALGDRLINMMEIDKLLNGTQKKLTQ